MANQPKLVILAAGAGTRYGGLKQLAPIGPHGETLLEYSVFDALKAGFEGVVLVVRPETEGVFRHRLDGSMARQVEVAYAHQALDQVPAPFIVPASRSKPWGTGQAVLAARPQVEGTFAVVNADDFYGAASFTALSAFLDRPPTEGPGIAVVGFEVADTLSDAGPVSRALCDLDHNGHLRGIVELHGVEQRDGVIRYVDSQGEEQTLAANELVSMNMWGFTPELFNVLQDRFEAFLAEIADAPDAEFLLPDVIRFAVSEGREEVSVLPQGHEWCGLTFAQDHQRVTGMIARLIERGHYPEELWR